MAKSFNEQALGQSITHIRAFKTDDPDISKVYIIGASKIYTFFASKKNPSVRLDEQVTNLRFL